MKVVESFLSIQGEGKFAGRLAVFVRFAGCNFNCVGFNVKKQKEGRELVGCDTLRAVFTKEYQNTYENLNAKELFLRVLKMTKDLKPIIVITGGEPLLHHKKSEFLKF
ncbi:7-carboxy-7-deazaguanine synthase QueE, partial [Campylobacter upsaliensis]|nr:7-carboxy-7-deazaguanine synthase QueE [Campylobacter upsaliensis]